METLRTNDGRAVRELPVVAGHLALDFANTVDDPEGEARFDHIATYPGLLRWSTRMGLVADPQRSRLDRKASAEPDEVAIALDRAHALRRVVGATFTEIAAGEPPAPELWAQLQPFAADAITNADLVPAGTAFALAWPDSDELHTMLRPVAQAAVDLLTGDELSRVKRCAGCPWLFLDRSKNSSRRWCAMDDCGKHEKIRRYVARRAAARQA